ncbi:MAG: hypothetical protein QXJ68_06665 [Methanocellales archaeon]
MGFEIVIDEEALEEIIDSYLDIGTPLTRLEIKSELVLMVQGEDIEQLLYMQEKGACLNCSYSRADPKAVKKMGRRIEVDFTIRTCKLGRKTLSLGEECKWRKPLIVMR